MKAIYLLLFIFINISTHAQDDSLYVEPIDTNHYYKGYFIQVQTSPFFTSNFFAKTQISDYSNPIKPEDMYTEYSGYKSGINFGYTAKDWLILTGLHYSKNASEFSIIEKKPIVVGTDTNIVDVETTSLNQYRYLHLPINFGYVSHFGNYSLTLKAGLFLSLNLTEEGYTYDFLNKELILLEDNFTPFLVSYSLTANIKYQLSNRVRLYLEPYYISGINSIWSESPVYAWKQVHYGAAFGIEYLISKEEEKINEE